MNNMTSDRSIDLRTTTENLLQKYAVENYGVARLRFVRRMSDIQPHADSVAKTILLNAERNTYEEMCTAVPAFSINPKWYMFSDASDRIMKKYLITEKQLMKDDDGFEWWSERTVGFRWDRLHGKKRKNLKYAIKKELAAVRRSIELHDKYAGRSDALCLEARLGTGNWTGMTWRMYSKEPWFLDACDGFYKDNFCYIYAKADPEALDTMLAEAD